MTLDDILRSLFGGTGGGPAIGGDPVQASMAGDVPMYDPQSRRYAGEAPRMPAAAPRMALGGQTAPAAVDVPRATPAAPEPSRATGERDPLAGLLPPAPSVGLREHLMDFGAALQGKDVPDREAMATKAAQDRLRANLTYRALLSKNVDPDVARAAIGNPEIAKQLIGQVFGERPKPTDEMREYEVARGQGFGGTFMDYKTQLKEAGASRVSIDQKQETEYDKKVGGLLAEDFVNANRGATTAQRDLSNLEVMKQALGDPNVYTGTGGQAIQSVKKAAQTLLGVDVKGVSSAEVMQNLASEIAVGNKQKLPGPMSDADRQFLVDMAPNLSKTPEGNRLIIELGMAHKRWEIARAEAVREYAAKHGGRLDPRVYEATGNLDRQAAESFSGIMAKLRGMGELAPRSPAAGVPNDPLGLRGR